MIQINQHTKSHKNLTQLTGYQSMDVNDKIKNVNIYHTFALWEKAKN